MKYSYLFILIAFVSCTTYNSKNIDRKSFTSKGFAYIYNKQDFNNKIIKNKIDNLLPLIGHNNLKKGTLLNITNPETKKNIKLKTDFRINYPDFYKILLTKRVSDLLELDKDFPYVEIEEIKKNKSFVAKKAKTHVDEKQIHANAPVTKVLIANISKQKKKKQSKKKKIFYNNYWGFLL